MKLANASPVLLRVCVMWVRDTIVNSLQPVDVSVLDIHLVCSTENAGELNVKAMPWA